MLTMISFIFKIGILYCFGFLLAVQCTSKDRIVSSHGSGSNKKELIPDLNLPAQDEQESYNSKHQRTIRLAKRIYKVQKDKASNFDEAYDLANKILTEKRRKWSAEARARKKSLGKKPIDYHQPGYYKVKKRVEREARRMILDENNGINEFEKAKELVYKNMRTRNTEYRKISRAKTAANKKSGNTKL